MKLLKSIILGVAGATMLSMTSCNDWLDVNDNPDTPSQDKVKVTTMLPARNSSVRLSPPQAA